MVFHLNVDKQLYTKYYNYDLNSQGEELYITLSDCNQDFGIFLKGIGLKNDYAAFAYFTHKDQGNGLTFSLEKFDNTNKKFIRDKGHIFSNYNLRTEVHANELFKLRDDLVVLFSCEYYNWMDFGSLHMFLIDFYNNYEGMKIRDYQFFILVNFSRKKCLLIYTMDIYYLRLL